MSAWYKIQPVFNISRTRTYLVGVSLRLQGVTLSSESLVDVDDIFQSPSDTPTNGDESHNQSLLCLTDLEDCCNDPRTRQGAWYYPDGTVVTFSFGENKFRRTRGPNEVMTDRQFYGSVRLFRQGSPPERGRFRCELPNAANPFVNQTIYANIRELTKTELTVFFFFLPFIFFLVISGHWSSEHHAFWFQHCRGKFHTCVLSKYFNTARHTSTTLSVVLWPK